MLISNNLKDSNIKTNELSQKIKTVNFKSITNDTYTKSPKNDSFETKNINTGTKVALGGSLITGVLALIDQFALKGKYRKKLFNMFKKDVMPMYNKDSGLTYLNNTPYTGSLERTSKCGILRTTYTNGQLVKARFTPHNNDKIAEVIKTYDNEESHKGVKIIKTTIKNKDNNTKYSLNAISMQKEFEPEIEKIIKLKDFDKIKITGTPYEKALAPNLDLRERDGYLYLEYNCKTIRWRDSENNFEDSFNNTFLSFTRLSNHIPSKPQYKYFKDGTKRVDNKDFSASEWF